MKSLSIVAAALTTSLVCFHAASAQTADALEAQANELRQILRDAPRLASDVTQIEIVRPRQGWELGMISWIAAGDDGLIYLLQRGDGADPVIALDQSGRMVRSWGRGMYATPHSIRVDPNGNVWTADAKSSRVLQFASDGSLLLEIAVGGQPEDCDGNFCGTTDVAFGPDGDVFIADGYRNARILRYTPDGRKVGEWGRPGTGAGEFRLPHSLAVDEDGIVYVADRENGRIQRFDRDGTFLGRVARLWQDLLPRPRLRGRMAWLSASERTERLAWLAHSGRPGDRRGAGVRGRYRPPRHRRHRKRRVALCARTGR